MNNKTVSYSLATVLDAVLPPPKPPKGTDAIFRTGRSGLGVAVSAAYEQPADAGGLPSVYVTVAGPVDHYDATQLAEFFTALSARLEAQSK